MNYTAELSGRQAESLGNTLKAAVGKRDVTAFGVASAFVTVGGFRALQAFLGKRKEIECRLLAGTSNSITHPQALIEALDAGWKVRIGVSTGNRIFHPKIMLSGSSFSRNGTIMTPSFSYVGSSNLTIGGLYGNVECGVFGGADSIPPGLVSCFATLWEEGRRATPAFLKSYANDFANRNRRRSSDDMVALGLSDVDGESIPTYQDLRGLPGNQPGAAMPMTVASAAWAGLESFTGGYRFQVEFPRAAGMILRRIIGDGTGGKVSILCAGDNTIREMSFPFYRDNGMFRLNIPNETPGVGQARQSHQGIALIEAPLRKNGLAKLTIVPPGEQLESIVARSVILGTWGKTPTRKYGWF